jgi:hypothetical protein
MKKTSTILTFGLIILTGWSCVNPYKAAARYRKKFDNKIAEFEKRNDIILIKSIWDIKSDTLNVNSAQFTKNEIPIVIPGTNTFNFLSIYDISTGQKIGIDSTFCPAGEFLTLKINKTEKGEYLLSNWGCHYGRTIHLRVD